MNQKLSAISNFVLLLIIFIVLSPTFTLAEEENIKELLDLSLNDLMQVSITTASKRAENIRDTPVSVMVITKEQIQERRYLSLIDLLRDLPGFDVQLATHEIQYHQVTLRGHAGSNKFLILQDGIRIDSPTGEAIPIAENIPLQQAKQVEIIYGPAAALYGADAFGGVINIITAQDLDNALISSTIGVDNYRYHSFQVSKQLSPDLSLALSGHLHHADPADWSNEYPEYVRTDLFTFGQQLFKPTAAREDYSAYVESNSLFARIDYSDLTLGFNHAFLRNPSTTGEKSNSTQYGKDAQWNTAVNTAYVKYYFQLNEQLTGETVLNYSTYEVDPFSKFKNIYVDYQDAYIYAKGEKQAIEQQFNYQLNDVHILTGGLSYERFYSLPKTTDLPHPYNPNNSIDQQNLFHLGTNNSLPIKFNEVNYHNYGLYLQFQSAWHEKFSSTLGLRYDENSRYGKTLNPRFGLTFSPNLDTVFKLFYGEAFRAPSPMDSFEVFGIFSGQQNEAGEYLSYFFQVPNAQLKPEKARSIELSLVKTVQENTNLSLSGYYTKVDNLIMSHAEDTPTQFIPGGLILGSEINDNIGQSTQYGVVLLLNYLSTLGGGFQAHLWGGYIFIDGNLCKSMDYTKIELPLIAHHKMKLGATFNYQKDYFITPQLYLVGRTNNYGTEVNSSAIPSSALTTPGYIVADLHLGTRNFFQNWSAYIDIYNLFDTNYYNAGFINSASNFSSVAQPTRRVMLSVQYEFR